MLTKEQRDQQIRTKKAAGVPNSQLMKEYKIGYSTLRLILDGPEGELER